MRKSPMMDSPEVASQLGFSVREGKIAREVDGDEIGGVACSGDRVVEAPVPSSTLAGRLAYRGRHAYHSAETCNSTTVLPTRG